MTLMNSAKHILREMKLVGWFAQGRFTTSQNRNKSYFILLCFVWRRSTKYIRFVVRNKKIKQRRDNKKKSNRKSSEKYMHKCV